MNSNSDVVLATALALLDQPPAAAVLAAADLGLAELLDGLAGLHGLSSDLLEATALRLFAAQRGADHRDSSSAPLPPLPPPLLLQQQQQRRRAAVIEATIGSMKGLWAAPGGPGGAATLTVSAVLRLLAAGACYGGSEEPGAAARSVDALQALVSQLASNLSNVAVFLRAGGVETAVRLLAQTLGAYDRLSPAERASSERRALVILLVYSLHIALGAAPAAAAAAPVDVRGRIRAALALVGWSERSVAAGALARMVEQAKLGFSARVRGAASHGLAFLPAADCAALLPPRLPYGALDHFDERGFRV